MSAERLTLTTSERAVTTAGREFARRYTNTLCELQLQRGIHQRIERLLTEFAEEHPNLRASYISRYADESYFSDGACGWEAAARPKLHGMAIDGENLFEFLAFAGGVRTYSAPLNTIVNVEEMWLEPAPEQPFILRVYFHHNFPATTILYAPDGDSQDAAVSFARRVKYLRGF